MGEDGTVTGTDVLRLFDVRDTPLSVDEVIKAVADPSAGGVAVFIGMVRDHDGEQGRTDGAEKLVGHSGERPGGFPGGGVGGSGDLHGPGGAAGADGFAAAPNGLAAPAALAAPGARAAAAVTGLEYVAHPTALAMLRETAEKVLADHPVTALAAVHRTGQLAVGDLAVVCAASAAHRAEAFAACRALIDTLKAQVPIWKREQFEDGSHIWVGC